MDGFIFLLILAGVIYVSWNVGVYVSAHSSRNSSQSDDEASKCPHIEDCIREVDDEWHERYCLSTAHMRCSGYKVRQPHNIPVEWSKLKEEAEKQ